MTTGRQLVHAILVNSRLTARLLRESANIRAIGNGMYNRFIEMAQNGAGVDEILMKLPIDIIHEPREFAEKICREAEYLKSIPDYGDESLGKPQNKSDETPPNGYAKTAGKPQNKLGDSIHPDNTYLLNNIFAESLYMSPAQKEARLQERAEYFKKRTFEVMQDIHLKDGLYFCYDKTIIAALHTPHGIFLGTNGIKKQPSQHKCPRKGDGINQGYDKCVKQCQQPAHAELAALQKYKALVAEPDFENSQMVVYGAKEVCYHCKTTLELVGIQRIILKPLNQLGEIHDYQ
jgi:hypothetical protein